MAHAAMPRVRLLGRPAVHDDEHGWRELPPGHKSAILGYLALADRWVGRDELIALFWPDRPETTARGNLRPLLAKLARDPLVVDLVRERTRVRWPVDTDHAEFLAANGEDRWHDAWSLAEGELLEGVTVAQAPEFESWLQIERAAVADARRTAGLHLADDALEGGDHRRAAEVLTTLRHTDPLDESVLRRWMLASARAGARADALTAYEAFVEHLRGELGVEPEPATGEIAEAIRSGSEGSTAAPPPERHAPERVTVPVPLTPLVGRRTDVTEVVARLEQPECRLLTLLGPGGIGKTRLALEIARVVAARCADGARVVDLAPSDDIDAMVAAVATAVGAELDGGEDGTQSVARALVGREMLLVLDNVEHIATAPGVIAELLSAAPSVRILATSRTALGLAAEWRYDVAGLSHRLGSTRPRSLTASARPGAEPPEPSDAAALFIAAAGRVTTEFAPSTHDLETIEGITANLGGSPLAIELAAAWVRVLDVDAVAAELDRGLDLLASDAPDRPERHASVQHVLDQSWSLLRPREQEAMRRMTVFRGGFDLAAARDVAEVELPTLLALVNRSFLARGADGRFRRHPLVWLDARRRARDHAAELDASRARHAEYYLRLVADHREAHRRPDRRHLLQAIEDDIENVAAAWRWAVAHDAHDLLLASIVGLAWFAQAHGRQRLADDLFATALATAPSGSAVRGMLLAAIGSRQTVSGAGALGVEKLREGVLLAEGRVDAVNLGWALFGLGTSLLQEGPSDEAAAAFERAAAQYRSIGDVDSELGALKSLASSRARCVREALRAERELEARARESAAPIVLWRLLGGITTNERLLGEFARAERAAREMPLHVADAAGDPQRVRRDELRSRTALAATYLERGRLDRAEALACRTLRRPLFAIARERFGDVEAVAAALVGRIALVRRDVDAAERWSRLALERHRADHGPGAAFDFVLETLARAALAMDDVDACAAWLEAVGRGPDPLWFEGRLMEEARRIACRCCSAEVALRRGDVDAARHLLHDSLDRARAAELIAAALGVLVSVARYLRVVGAEERTAALLRYVRGHPRATFETRSAAALELGGEAGQRADGADDGPEGVSRVASQMVPALDVASRTTTRDDGV